MTRVVVRLLPEPGSRETALLAVGDFARVARLLGYLNGAYGGTLSAYEVMWQDFYALMSGVTGAAPLPPTHEYYVLI